MQEFRRLNAIHFPGLEMLEPEFIPGEDCAPLQAADLLAWLVRKDASNAFNRVDRRWAAEVDARRGAVHREHREGLDRGWKLRRQQRLSPKASPRKPAGREPGVAETEKGGPDARLPS